MAVIIGVRQKGLFPKKIEWQDILIDGMGYGVFGEGHRLEEHQTGKFTIVYFRKNIQRGFEVLLEQGAVYLKFTLPSSEEEIRALFSYTRFLCEYLETDRFIYNDQEYGLEQIDELIAGCIEASVQTLWDIRRKIDGGECRSLFIFGAKNPIALGKEEMQEVNGNLERFGALLHRLQSMDVYYAIPALYRLKDGSSLGVYIISADTPSVFPLVPGDGMFLKAPPETWKVMFSVNGQQAGVLMFDDLIAHVDSSRRYDDKRVILTLSADEIRTLSEEYGTNL